MQRIFILLFVVPALYAQTGTLTGRVTDQSGAVVPSAAVVTTGPSGTKKTAAGANGGYSFTGLALGAYKVSASAPKLSTPQPATNGLPLKSQGTADRRLRLA